MGIPLKENWEQIFWIHSSSGTWPLDDTSRWFCWVLKTFFSSSLFSENGFALDRMDFWAPPINSKSHGETVTPTKMFGVRTYVWIARNDFFFKWKKWKKIKIFMKIWENIEKYKKTTELDFHSWTHFFFQRMSFVGYPAINFYLWFFQQMKKNKEKRRKVLGILGKWLRKIG